jgi:hypothetical protein
MSNPKEQHERARNSKSGPSNATGHVFKGGFKQLTHEVYVGIRSGKPVYVGITSGIASRACQHGDRFDAMVKLTNGSAVTKDQARAIEQALINMNPQFENQINSIASSRPWYQDAVEWGRQWLGN